MNYVMVAVVYAAICMKSVNETLPILYINVALLARRRVLPLVSCVAYVSVLQTTTTDASEQNNTAPTLCIGGLVSTVGLLLTFMISPINEFLKF